MRVVRNWLLFRTFEVDVIRSILTIHNVEDYTYKDSAMIGTFTFNKISYKDNALLIECCQSLELRMAISDIEIESCDVEIKGKSRISCFLLVEISTGKVYK